MFGLLIIIVLFRMEQTFINAGERWLGVILYCFVFSSAYQGSCCLEWGCILFCLFLLATGTMVWLEAGFFACS